LRLYVDFAASKQHGHGRRKLAMRVVIRSDFSVRVSGLETGKMKLVALNHRKGRHFAVVRIAGETRATGARGWGTTYSPAHTVVMELKGYTVYHGDRIEGTTDYPFMLEWQSRDNELADEFKVKE
jgi:hypothetical protein